MVSAELVNSHDAASTRRRDASVHNSLTSWFRRPGASPGP